MERTAVLSECGTYRYELTRRWDDGPSVTWIMLNPSRADATVDDPTIRRCIGFAKSWGYSAITVRNLYGLRATKPAALWCHPDPVGPENDAHLLRCVGDPLVVCAWGAQGRRGSRVIKTLGERHAPLHILAFTDGVPPRPRHPLYLKADLTPIRLRHGWDQPIATGEVG